MHPYDALATPLIELDDGLAIAMVNAAAAAWLGTSPRRLIAKSVDLLGASPGDLRDLCQRAREHDNGLRAQRIGFAAADGETRFAHVLANPRVESGLRLELHPTEEFAGEDPATLLPAALSVALKGLAHEVKNPLAGLKGAAQLLQRRLSDGDSTRYLEVILAETERLSNLMERLLNPTPERAPEGVNIHAVLERVRLLAEAEAGWAVRIVRDYDPSLPEIQGDPDRLTQALLNLVRNALQADASEVRLRTRAENGVVIGDHAYRLALRVDVVDDGRGVPESLTERIFLPLVTGRAEGTGLGLALAQQVAREHAGSLGFRSRPGHTVFTLLLPVGGSSGNEDRDS
ncbi:MAG: PAS domain-containing sensor histidine kinase [Xanthomonadales bacterium]|nr:PAS domain-containing sensor histidine kinase [Xanthomonadales bacterium]